MRSAVTISLVPEATSGPFVFSSGLEDGCRHAADLGFDGVELFVAPLQLPSDTEVRAILSRYGLALAAVGTGAGALVMNLDLCSARPTVRQSARVVLGHIVNWAGGLGAPAILGSMKGCVEPGVSVSDAEAWLAESLRVLSRCAARNGQTFLLEPLNRYETNLLHTLDDGVGFIRRHLLENVMLLADFFHMNIEEANAAESLARCLPHVGHVHFADSNRRAPGFGQTDMARLVDTLSAGGYRGYLSAEVLPYPSPVEAAAQFMHACTHLAHRESAVCA